MKDYPELPPLARAYAAILTEFHTRYPQKGVLALGSQEGTAEQMVPLPKSAAAACALLSRTVGDEEVTDLMLALRCLYYAEATLEQTRSLLSLTTDAYTLAVAESFDLSLLIFETGAVCTVIDDFLVSHLGDEWQVHVKDSPLQVTRSLPSAISLVRHLRRSGAAPQK
jgi:hypothetical protein